MAFLFGAEAMAEEPENKLSPLELSAIITGETVMSSLSATQTGTVFQTSATPEPGNSIGGNSFQNARGIMVINQTSPGAISAQVVNVQIK